MPALIAALVSGGLDFGQGMLGSRSEKKQRRRYGRRLNRALNLTESIQGNALGQQEAFARQGTQQMLGGYDSARKEAARLGRGGKRDALDREAQLGASLSQGMANRGLGSTTVGANLSRGLASDTSRQMANIDEGLAGLYGNLALGRAGVEAQGSERLGQLAGQRGELMSGLAQMRTMRDLYGSSPWGGGAPLPTRENSFGQNLLGGLQAGLGMYGEMGNIGGAGDAGGGMDPQTLMMWKMMQKIYGGNLGDIGMGSFGIGDLGHEELQGPYQANGQY